MPVEFRLLGAVELRVDGVPVDLGHARRLSVLAILLVDANQVVPADQLIDRVWGERPPHTARNTLHGYLHRLRQTLADVPGVGIGRGPGGYVLTVDPGAVDLHRFRGLVAEARGTTEDRALPLLDEALRLWQGDPLPGVTTRGSTTCAAGWTASGSPPNWTVPTPGCGRAGTASWWRRCPRSPRRTRWTSGSPAS